ncbi:STAS/SEC14 domain-containing protein [Marimonas sp. MJW-29]|uniref:STAS/SEC14 domain-containing protein n=1 Tax=Sulfitobacter sediminis TaxID=3234186 RepID=A0ABV3RMI4_9RHOB
MTEEKQHFEILDGFAADVLAIAAHGQITREDYETVLIPEFKKKVAEESKVKLFFVFGDDFTGYSPGAAWDDAKFGLLHLRDFAGLAVVTDLQGVRLGMKAFAPLISGPVVVFHLDEMEEAKTWVNEWKHDQEGGPEVDVDARLSTLEDTA